MQEKDEAYLRDLISTPSVTGEEYRVASLVRERLGQCADEVVTDVMGNVAAHLKGQGSAPSVMFAAHMDEIGMMVSYISDEGFLSVMAVGGVDAAILPGLRVDVHTKTKTLRGILGRKPIHLISPDERTKVTPLSELHIDLGLPAEEVKELVSVGDTLSFASEFEPYGKDMAVSRAFDDKAGIWAITRALELIAEAGTAQGECIAVATVQEEIGTRGAITASYSINPDVGIAFDVTHATDYPGIAKTKYGDIRCGGGPVIARGPNINPVVFERLCAAAEAEGIAYQVEAEPGATGTDARSIQVARAGKACGLVSLPLRYMHTPVEAINLQDLEDCARLLARFVLDMEDDLSFIPGM